MSDKIKLFRKHILFLIIIPFLGSCSYINIGYGPIEGKVLFSKNPLTPETYHTVETGESLWEISEKYYNNPLFWPLLYKINHDRIYDADLIFPGQSILVVNNFTQAQKRKAVKHALNRGIWIIGYQEEKDQEFLLN